MDAPQAIFYPVIVLAMWTGIVLFITAYRRIGAVRARTLRPSAFKLGDSQDVPEHIALANRNLMNLLEMPVLFYVVVLAEYVTGNVAPLALILAWLYVGLRLAHSIVHLTTNHILLRLSAFAASNLVLLGLWVDFAVRLSSHRV